MIENKFKVIDPAGLHARPVSLLTKIASQYSGDVFLTYNDKKANMKSIINVMALGIKQGAEFSIIVEGQEEDVFMKSVINLLLEHKLTSSPSVM